MPASSRRHDPISTSSPWVATDTSRRTRTVDRWPDMPHRWQPACRLGFGTKRLEPAALQGSDAYEGLAASACAMSASADAFKDLSVMELAMRSARSGSVVASACAMLRSAHGFESGSVMELAMRAASVRSRTARSGSVAASACAISASARALDKALVPNEQCVTEGEPAEALREIMSARHDR